MGSTRPLERTPLRSRIHAIVREQIVRGELAPGVAVRDGELAEALGASRTPVREALIQLAAEGLLDSHVGRGFRVPPLLREEVAEAHPLMTTLEPLALSLAAPCTKRQARELERLTRRLESEGTDALSRHELDGRWHRCLIAGCTNGRLLRYIDELGDVLRRYELVYLRGVATMESSVREHRTIAEAYAAGERDLAVERLREHWGRAKDELFAILPKDDEA